MGEEEPLRVELNRRAFEANKTIKATQDYPINVVANYPSYSPPVQQKKKIEEEDIDIVKEKAELTVSPYRRRFLTREQSNNMNSDKIGLRSNEIAENLKKMINKELENFNKECDVLKDKINKLLIPDDGNGNEKARIVNNNEDSNFKETSKYSPLKIGKDMNDVATTTITKRIERLMGEIEEKKNNKNSLNNPTFLFSDRGEYNTSSLAQEYTFNNKATYKNNQFPFDGDKY